MEDEKPRPVWAVTVGDNTRFVDAESVREQVEQWHRDDRPFLPIADVVGAEPADELVSELVRAVLTRAGIPETRFADLSALTKVDCTPHEGAWVLRVSCYGSGFDTDWDGSVEAARATLEWSVRDLAGQIKADRGYAGGRHPWDD